MSSDRAVSPVLGTTLMVSLVVVLAAVVGVSFFDVVEEAKDTNEKPIPVSDNLLSNGGFEDGATNKWQDGYDKPLAGRSVITQTDPYSGSYGLEMDNTPPFVGQDTTKNMEAGKIYRMCAVSKVSNPSSSFWVGVQYYDSGGNILEKATYEIKWTTFEEKCVLTDFTENQAAASAEVWVYYDSGSATAYVDDISLKEVQYLADPDKDTDDQ
ncbi:type IV pilin [Halorussus salinus]|uniref:type IV pilin n=1 Tax=Halorussus salinus TaxID=1364935 RepID=UPI001091F5DC|nr:type IV pilin [Halorussus salinus]